MTPTDFIPTVRIGEPRLGALLDRLDQEAKQSGASERRVSKRTPYRVTNLRAVFAQPGGSVSKHLLVTRDVSPQGLGFIHGGFIHPGTRCVVEPRQGDHSAKIPGRVCYCRLVEGAIHSVGIRFDQKVDPALFLSGSKRAHSAAQPQRPAPKTPPVPALDANTSVLALVGDQPDAAALAHILQGTRVTLLSETTIARALIRIKLSSPAAAIIDGSPSDADPADSLARLRAAGLSGPIVVITADPSPRTSAALVRAGATCVIIRPCPAPAIAALIVHAVGAKEPPPAAAAYLRTAADPADQPLYSTIARPKDPASAPPGGDPVAALLVRRDAMALALADAILAQDRNAAQRACRTLRHAAAGAGFMVLVVAAERALAAIEFGDRPLNALEPLKELDEVLRALAQRAAA